MILGIATYSDKPGALTKVECVRATKALNDAEEELSRLPEADFLERVGQIVHDARRGASRVRADA